MNSETILFGIVGLLGLTVVGVILSLLFVTKEYNPEEPAINTFNYEVVALNFIPSKNSTGVGPVMSGNGGVAVVSSYTSESNIIVLKNKSNTIKIDNKNLFNEIYNIGQSIKIHEHNTWYRIRLTSYKFGFSNEICEAEVNGKRINVLGTLK